MPGVWRWRWLAAVADDRHMTYAIDPELAPWADMLPELYCSDRASLLAARAAMERLSQFGSTYETVHRIETVHTTVPGPAGAPDVRVRVVMSERRAKAMPGLFYIHGGGFVMCDLETCYPEVLRAVDQLGVVVVAPEYRLAPENPFPAPIEDCYAALTWMATNAAELGIDSERLGVAGGSAGGGLAAAVALLARDRGGPSLCFQLLDVPELDDRLDTPSMRAYHDAPQWDKPSAIFSWRSYLGAEPGSPGVSPYAAPGRAEDLSGLPPAFIAVCQFDPLRDEGIAYAQRLMHAGVPTELHHYPGTFHGVMVIDHAAVTRRIRTDQIEALRRGLKVVT
jgi:acetyl esterase